MTLVSTSQLYALIDMIINFCKVTYIIPHLSIHFMISFISWLGVSFAILKYTISEFSE